MKTEEIVEKINEEFEKATSLPIKVYKVNNDKDGLKIYYSIKLFCEADITKEGIKRMDEHEDLFVTHVVEDILEKLIEYIKLGSR